jgi:hypothetical protein
MAIHENWHAEQASCSTAEMQRSQDQTTST